MTFSVKPTISDCNSLREFFTQWKVGQSDLVVTSEYILVQQLGGSSAPCDCLYYERFGNGEPSDEMVNAMLDSISGKDELVTYGMAVFSTNA